MSESVNAIDARAAQLHARVLSWYSTAARDLPWRRSTTSPWGVLVSEVMLQQTPVSRVLPVYDAWMRRWPQPAGLAAEAPGEAVRAWGRLGYPRRALRLHAAARQMVTEHSGEVPASYEELRALPGVGDYTAAAVLSFAYGRRRAVLDTNVRRVLARVVDGREHPPAAITVTERRVATALLPEGEEAPRWAVGVMELGALVCTSRAPQCEGCPVRGLCAWEASGRPAGERPRPQAAYAGSDRQTRGLLLARLREAVGAVDVETLLACSADAEQATRCLGSLEQDGLIERMDGSPPAYSLPSLTGATPRPSSASAP